MSNQKRHNSLSLHTDGNLTQDCIITESYSPWLIHPEHARGRSTTPLVQNFTMPEGDRWVYEWQRAIFRVKANIALKKLKSISVLYGTELSGDDCKMLEESEILQDRRRKKKEIKIMEKAEKEKLPWYIVHPKKT